MSIKDYDTIYRFCDYVFIKNEKGYAKYAFDDSNGVPVLDFVENTKYLPPYNKKTTMHELGS